MWMDGFVIVFFMDVGWWMIFKKKIFQFWLIQKNCVLDGWNLFSCLRNWWFGVKAFFSKHKKKEKEASPLEVLRKLVCVKNRDFKRTFFVFFWCLKESKRSKKDPFMHGYWLIGVGNQKAYYPIHWFRV